MGDLNGDGKLDLAVTEEGSALVSVLLGNGDGTFQTPKTCSVGNAPESVVVGDFNGDGKPDLAVAGSSGVSVLLGNGNGTFQSQTTFTAGTGPFSMALADFNGDGMLDLATVNGFAGSGWILLGR